MSEQDRAIKLYAQEISDRSEYTKPEDDETASEDGTYISIEVEEATEILTRFAEVIRSSAPDARLSKAIGHLLVRLDREYTGNGSTLHQQALIKDMNAVRAALSETKAVCEWVPNEYGGEITHYDGTCGSAIVYLEGGLAAHGYNFCPRCGLPISVKEK